MQRAALWAAEDVRCALSIIASTTSHPKACITLFTNCIVALEQATRRKKRPSALKPAKFTKFCDVCSRRPPPRRASRGGARFDGGSSTGAALEEIRVV